MRYFFLSLVFLFIYLNQIYTLNAQTEKLKVTAKYVTEHLHLDGVLDESIWEKANSASGFWQFFPNDTIKANYNTEVKVLYNDHALLIGIRAEAPHNKFVVTTLKRDFSGTLNDNVTIVLDTYSDGTNAFAFGITPYGVQRELLISNGGSNRDSYNNTWDMKWQGESKIYDNYYTAEMVIPFHFLKFKEGSTKWGFRPYRFNLQTNEQTTWVQIPQTQLLGSLAFMGEIEFEKPLGKSHTPIALIPYINGISQKDFENGTEENSIKIGGDAKIAVGTGMNLDLTVIPDFSNVEVDGIFTNLSRFEFLLPEKRQFFIDNSDLFNTFGNTFNEARPFFSRRIGLARDTSDNLIQNKIIAGVRLSGKLNKDWRIGFLNMQTEEDLNNEIASNNNGMLAIQRKIGNRSNIGAFIVNRQTFGEYDFITDTTRYNRVIGADFNLASADNIWTGKIYLHKSFQPFDESGNYSSQVMINYNKNNFVYITEVTFVENDFKSDLGFVPRTDILKAGNLIRKFFYPKNRTVLNRYSQDALFINIWRPSLDYKVTDQYIRFNSSAFFTNQSTLVFGLLNEYIYLANSFDPTRTTDGTELPEKTDYRFTYTTLDFTSTQKNLFTYSANTIIGQFYNGNRYSVGGSVNYRVQPWVQFGVSMNYDGIRLPDKYPSADIWLLTPSIDVTFSKTLFWSTLIQYSNQRENLGINSRLQWRFAPLSDLYIVYNDNYHTGTYDTKFRSINLKCSYWLNL